MLRREKRQAAKHDLILRARKKHADEEARSLVQRLKTGDQRAFETLYRRYCGQVYRQVKALVGNEAETEEIVQDVFLTLHQKARTFRGDSAFSTWLYRLTMNSALGKLRRRKRSRELNLDDHLPRYQADGHHLLPVVDWSRDVERHLLTKELHRILRHALDQLPPKDKAVVILSDLEGISNKEIGKSLGLSVPAVKTRLHRARLILRGKLSVTLGHSSN